MSITSEVNSILKTMHNQSVATNKGVYGERAVKVICEDLYQRCGGILIHSYTYKTIPELPGNIKRGGCNGYYIENLGGYTEIDILLVTPYKIFPIEVKAYKADKITIYNEKITGAKNTDKSPEHQNEMHCRHLYPHIFKSIPDGISKYIVPIVVFADETVVEDKRSSDRKDYIEVTILNNLRSLLEYHNKPYNNYKLDLKSIDTSLRSAMISNDSYLPLLIK